METDYLTVSLIKELINGGQIMISRHDHGAARGVLLRASSKGELDLIIPRDILPEEHPLYRSSQGGDLKNTHLHLKRRKTASGL